MMKGLGVPVQNQYGLRPATVKGTNQITPLTAFRDLDSHGWLSGVTTFNFHPHLPHYALTTDDTKSIRVLSKQSIDMSRPHPFTEAGNTEFNNFLWMPPDEKRAGDILLSRLNDIHDSLRRRRVAGNLLEKSCDDSARDGDPCLATKISKPTPVLTQRPNRQPVKCEASHEPREQRAQSLPDSHDSGWPGYYGFRDDWAR